MAMKCRLASADFLHERLRHLLRDQGHDAAAVDAVLELWHTYDRHLGAVIGRGDLPSPEEAFNEIRRLGIHVDD